MRVTTPFLTYFGGAFALTGFALAVVGVFSKAWLGAFFLFALFGCGGLALFLTGGTIQSLVDGIDIKKPHSHKQVIWREMSAVESGGGNLVFHLKTGGRVVAPGIEFWVGADKAKLLEAFSNALEEHQVAFKTSARAMFHSGDRR